VGHRRRARSALFVGTTASEIAILSRSNSAAASAERRCVTGR
jgi:hypothetical protein